MEDEGYLDTVLAQGAGELQPKALDYQPLSCGSRELRTDIQVAASHLTDIVHADKADEAATRTLDSVREVSVSY